ncbi:C40 family peptidase, partial [Mediterraneibacter faecis]|nr:C40 family peptidase [Mediterraneibacter faecis]
HKPTLEIGKGGAFLLYYVGNNQMYHAGNPIGYTDLTSAYWQQHIICAGRIKQ